MIALLAPAAEPTPRARPLVVLTAASLALLALSLLWAAVDGRTFGLDPVWLKPMKFAVSFAAMFGTLALLDARLSPAWRDGWTARGTAFVLGAALLAEMTWVFHQAARARASHYNAETVFEAAMYRYVMGVGAVLLVLGIGVYGVIAWRDREARLGPALRAGVALGFGLSFVLTLLSAGVLSAQGGHFIGTPGPGAATIPFFGWSAAVGDLRPTHFVALHAMQALPLLGWWLDRRGRSPWLVAVAAVAYVALTGTLFAQAWAGLPLIRL